MADATVSVADPWTGAHVVAGSVCLAALVLVARNRRGADRLMWTLLALGVGLFVAVGLASLVWSPRTGTGSAPWWLLAMGSGALAGGVGMLIHRGAGGREGLLDTTILAVGLAVPLWTFVVRPVLGVQAFGLVGVVLVLQLVACTGAVWLLVATGGRRSGLWFLAAGTGLVFVGSPLGFSGLLDVRPGGVRWPDAAWLAGFAALGAATLSRSVRADNDTASGVSDPSQRLGWQRVCLLAVALLIGPIASLVNMARGITGYHTAFRPIAVALLGALALWRLAGVAAARGRAEQHSRQTAATLQAVWDSAPSGIMLLDGAGRVASANPAVRRMFDYRDDELAGERIERLVPDFERLGAQTPDAVWVREVSARRKDGHEFPVELRMAVAGGTTVSTVTCILTDISGRKQAERRLRDSEERFRLLVDGVSDYAIIMLDPDGRVRSWNSGAERIKGYRAEEIIGRSYSRFYPPEAVADGEPERQLRIAARQGRLQVDGWRLRADGSRFWASTVITALFTEAGALRGYAKVTCDASERRRLESELRHQALHDSLTGLPNRALMRDRIDQALRHAARQEHHVALLLIDLDDFKRVNDALGHQVGDVVLQKVGERLQATLRSSDTVARLGGDEFAVVVPDLGPPEAAEAVATKILSTLEAPLTVEESTLTVGASLGIAVYPLHADSEAMLFRRADIAMYRAKESTTGYAFYAEDYDRNALERLQIIAQLRTAIDSGQLVLYYQPKVDLNDGRAVTMEALVRWRHPTRGLLTPDRFIPIAEETGLIKPLTDWVVHQALSDCRQWRATHSVNVAVNLSPQSLQDPSLVEGITTALRGVDAPPGMLQLEITETSIMVDRPRAIEAMYALGDAGVRFAIDDFGTGYSSLAQLLDLPVEEVKIDKSFVADMATRKRAASVVRAVIDLGDNLGLRVVAEGVEDEPTHERLRHLGCHCGQGFLYQAPEPLGAQS